ncbi:hypothetical protein L7F22_047627 [Adiantum nelumboides]|nr:hypothetical protein [Adiantum nelumboides]
MANVMSCVFEKHWKTFNSTFNQRLRAGGWGNYESDDVAQDMLSPTRFSAAERFNNKLKTPANKSSSEPGLKKHQCLPVKSTKSIGRVPNIRSVNLVVDSGSVMSISTGQTIAKWQQLDRIKNNGLRKPPERELNKSRSRGQIITEDQSTDNVTDARELYQTSFKVPDLEDEDPQDEYVDIGDNMQLSSIPPPVIIDRNGCSSSSSSGSSSSSSSGSSSSSNISGSDTDSESDADSSQFVSSAQASPIKEPLYNETRANFPLTEGPAHEKTFLDERAETHEGPPHEITLLGERADTQEDEMVKQGSQVSPGRLVRETLLKNRFADIILKSKEQLQPQKEDTANTEKLRREREELQKQKNKSIQAQLRNGAAIVASIEMSQREADRQAARETLIQLELAAEPTVNYDIMEGLDSMGSFFKSGISLSSMINQRTDLYQGGKIQI